MISYDYKNLRRGGEGLSFLSLFDSIDARILMISPTPFSLLFALLLCFPLAVVFNTFPTTKSRIKAAVDVDSPCDDQFSNVDAFGELLVVKVNFSDGIEMGVSENSQRLSLESVDQVKELIENRATDEEKEEETGQSPPPLMSPPTFPPIQVDYKEDYVKLATASMVDSRARRPFKLAFMFLITDALPFAPLWEAFFSHAPTKLYNVYIHADPSIKNSTAFTGVFANRLIESKPTRRYSPTLISAARRLLAHALIHDPSNSHFALISASCIPLHSFKFMYKTLASSRKSFVEILPNEPGAYERWTARGHSAMLPDVPFEMSRIGSQFWILTRRHARTVVRDKRIWAKFKQECIRWYDCYPEESYFPTLLSVRDEKGCVPATLTHVDWKGREDGHPRSYSSEEVDIELISMLRTARPRYGDELKDEMGVNVLNESDSGIVKRMHTFIFARKFDADAIGALMKIAGVILKD